MAKHVAVVLCGCGRGDGSEIHESTSVLIHLSRLGITYQCFAPDAPQAEVLNHATNQKSSAQTRNMMVEAARIARGAIKPLASLDASEFGGVVFPGGFGVAKNLCDFATKGSDCTVHPEAEQAIRAFHKAKKAMAMCCIAPVLAARLLGTRAGGPGCKVTIGTDQTTSDAISTMGSSNIAKGVTEAFVDDANRLVTTPAYMDSAATPWQVHEGIGRMVEAFEKLVK
jgi:enhancing lycopene biosynthesis protein 2